MFNEMKAELHRIEEAEVIKRITQPTEWVSAIHIVHEADGKLKIYLDSQNLNKAILCEHLELPTREVMARMAGAKRFYKLDCSKEFWQLQLDEESSRLCTFITPEGRYRYQGLPFGKWSAPEIYHRTIHNMLEGMKNVETSMDDIVIGELTQNHIHKR